VRTCSADVGGYAAAAAHKPRLLKIFMVVMPVSLLAHAYSTGFARAALVIRKCPGKRLCLAFLQTGHKPQCDTWFPHC
jgi:hypothetical protein